jgi:adenylosuccinate lyase
MGPAQRVAVLRRAKDFKQLLLADKDVMAVLDSKTVEDTFDLKMQLKNVDAIFDRVFNVPVGVS